MRKSMAWLQRANRAPAPSKLPSTCLSITISSLKSSPANRSNGRLLLRQPLEDGAVTISRAAVSVTFPSRFMLAAAMNPCPCGYFGDPTKECHCTPPMIQRYVSKISGPLLDRIDIHIEVPAVKYKELRAPSSSEDSSAVRGRVIAARDRQTQRFQGEKATYSNAQMSSSMIRKFCGITADGEKLLENAITRLGLSARAHDRILKVARTIADLDGGGGIEPRHLSEAIQYRTLDRSYWACDTIYLLNSDCQPASITLRFPIRRE